jgi:formylglycine-generating enzyme required for sulfatase activity
VSGFKLWGLLSLMLVCLIAATGPVAAEPRVALVIGNGNYGAGFSKLPNPPNDAKLVSKALKDAGFEVITVLDADQKAMKRAFVDFGKKLADKGGDAVGLFYYAGHGVQVDGKNYLIPTGASIETQTDVDMEAVNADWVLQQMEFAGNRMNIIILDACRNNPLPGGKRSAEKGLARMDAPRGSFLAYSTAPGATAADGKGTNSPYSQALANAIENTKVPLEQLFRQVRVDVMNATGQDQVPWDSSSLTGEFYFKKPDGSAPAQQTALLAPPPSTQPAAQTGGTTSKAPEPAVALGKTFHDCGDCPEMVSIPAGSFTMGSPKGDEADRPEERPQVKVTIGKPFALMATEVTRDQFAAFMKDTQREAEKGCYAPDGGEGKWDDKANFLNPGFKQEGNHPVVCVSWSDAQDYAEWLSNKTGKHYRLPTEEERDYAARGGKKTVWPWGEDSASVNGCKVANVFDKAGKAKYPINEDMLPCSDNFAETGPVDAFAANGFGLKGLIGNAWEWAEDCYHETYQGAPGDGSAWESDSCEKRVLRGSSYIDNVWDSRFASRDKMGAGDRNTNVGFRLARDL